MEDATLEELHEMIIELKRKHYIENSLTKEERNIYNKAKRIFKQKIEELPQVTPVGCHQGIDIEDHNPLYNQQMLTLAHSST